MSKGPKLDLSKLALYSSLNANFRIILDYHIGQDQFITRLDVKIGNEQYAVAFVSGPIIPPTPGNKIFPNDDLITPNNSIEDCMNLKINKEEFVKALKELIIDIENG